MGGHWARIVALALVGVNAVGCAPRGARGPENDPTIWESYLGDAGRASSAQERLATELAPSWRANAGRRASGAPAVGDRVVAVMSFDRHVTVVDRTSGERLWRKRLNAAGAAGVLLAGDRLYTATGGRDGRVWALALVDASKLWSADVGPVSGPLAAAGATLVAATEGGRVFAMDSADGSFRWRRALDGPVRGGASVFGDRVFVATDDSLFALSLEDGEPVASVEIAGALVTAPAFTRGTVIAASPDGVVSAWSSGDLHPLWTVEVDEPIFGSPAVARDSVFVVTITGRLHRIPLADPDGRTAVDLDVPVRAAPAPVADGILVGTLSGEIVFASSDGPPRRRARFDGPIEQQPIVRDGTLLVLDGRGRIHAWK